MRRNSSYPRVHLRVVKGRARTDRCVFVSVGVKNSCASVYNLTTAITQCAWCYGEGHARKFIRVVRSTWCPAWCASCANYDQVDVTRWRPRSQFLPLWFPNLATKIAQYIQTLTLSLFLLNVLPLPQLDGGILLDAVLRHFERKTSVEIDVEAGMRERGAPSRSLRGGLPSRLLRVLTMGLLGGCGLLTVGDVILGRYMRSSG